MRKAALSAGAIALLTGCSLAPHYTVPTTAAPPSFFKEAGPWTPAAPADGAARGAWWQVIKDPILDALEQRIEQTPPRLAAAVARRDQALALVRRARSDQFPQIDATGSARRERTLIVGDERIQRNLFTVGGAASYEVDLWGRIRSAVTAQQADAQAAEGDLANVKLSLQADVATNYLELRGLDGRIALLRQTITAFRAALELTTKRFVGGAAGEPDVARAQTQLSAAQSELEQRVADRATYEHAIAALVGEQASTFVIPERSNLPPPPVVPVSAPSLLLQRRPDIAAAERRVAAANARIGVARAAFFPAITLEGSGGLATTAGSLLSASSTVWALGPAMLLQSIFDGGRRRADTARARAEFDEASANYRQIALDAFRDVEDQLTLVNRLATASARQDEAARAAVRSNQLADILYTEGARDYLEVVVAQQARLQNQEVAIALNTRRLLATVNLMRALGGSWQPEAR